MFTSNGGSWSFFQEASDPFKLKANSCSRLNWCHLQISNSTFCNTEHFVATPQLTASALELECIRCIPSCLVRNKLSVLPSGPCWVSGLQSWSVGCITDLTLDQTPQKPEQGQDYISYAKNTQTKGTKLYCWPTLAKATLSDLKRMLSSVKAGASFRDWMITEKRTEVTPEPWKSPLMLFNS